MKAFSKIILFLFTFYVSLSTAYAQDMTALVQKVKAKLNLVNDYIAEGKMKTDVAFIKAPVGKVKVYYKKPDKFRLKRDGGISILPKSGVTLNMGSVIATNDYVALSAGDAVLDGFKTKIVKLLPMNENSDIVLTTLYIDEANLLIRKAITTTKENGTYEIEMVYGKYSNYGLPDKVVFSFNTQDYKIPKGVTLEFDEQLNTSDRKKMKSKKGRVEITYSSYLVNHGLADSVFK